MVGRDGRRIPAVVVLALALLALDQAQSHPSADKPFKAADQTENGSLTKSTPVVVTPFEIQSIRLGQEANRISHAAAVAAEKQARYAFWGTILVGVSAILSLVAAIAGAVAATASLKSFSAVKVAERAYIAADAELSEDEKGLNFIASNVGRTHAHVRYIRFSFLQKLPRPGLADIALSNLECNYAIEPSKKFCIANIPIPSYENRKYLVGYIEYKDVYNSRWYQHFRYDYMSGSHWVRGGGRKWSRVVGTASNLRSRRVG